MDKYRRPYAEWSPEQKERAHVAEKKWREKNKAQKRDYKLRYKFGIDLEDYNQMLEQQRYRCALCQVIVTGTLHVDHNHKTGAVRGLLCRDCNTGLGMFRDNIETLQQAIEYLSKDDK